VEEWNGFIGLIESENLGFVLNSVALSLVSKAVRRLRATRLKKQYQGIK
jgi:hypothetical protein